MATPCTDEFKDIGYHEYKTTEEVPFSIDTESITINFTGTVMPVKPRTEMFQDRNPKLIMKKIHVPAGQEFNEAIKRAVLREAKCLHYAKHRHVIRFETAFFHSGEGPEGSPYIGIIMDRADRDIQSYLEAKWNPQELSQIGGWFRCLASVVAYVHGIGITHRDIKPPNILIKNGKVFLADFGISKMALVKTIPTTMPNDPRGRTPQYAAPEVENGSTRGRSADIFSLGAVFLEMLIAYSFPQKRSELVRVLHAPSRPEQRGGVQNANIPSYANRLDDVQEWINRFETGHYQQWQKQILRLCGQMMSRDREDRPDSKEVYRTISSTAIPNVPPSTCCLRMGEDDEMTEQKRLVEMCNREIEPEVSEVEEILKQGASSDTIGAIHQASAHGFKHVVRTLLDHGANVNLQDHSNQTALHCASGYGQDTVVGILLGKKAKINLQDDEGRTPLFYACGYGSLPIVEALLRQGAHVRIQDRNAQTVLHLAAKGTPQAGSNHLEVIRALLQYGADINAKDGKGKEPRHYAQLKGYIGRVKLLSNDAPGAILAPDPALTDSRISIARELSEIIRPPRRYSDDDIQRVSDQLRGFNLGWEKLARIYIVLNIIVDAPEDSLRLLKSFKERNITDYQLPIREELMDILESPGARARFKREQSKVLTDTFQFRELGEHSNIGKEEWRGMLEEVEVLGEGNSGKVYKVRVRETGQLYALKTIDRTGRKAEEELRILKRVKHQNLVSLVGSFTSPDSIGILMDPAADCNLAKYMDEGPLDDDKRSSLLSYFGCLVNALSYLHGAYVRHNDIKPQNILVHRGRVLLADFGISLDWSETLRTTTWAPAARSPLYCAPEVVQEGRSRNSKADIWSLGCVFLEMMTVLKGRRVSEIRAFFERRPFRSIAYNDNISDVFQWIMILETQDQNIRNEPLTWIHEMLQQDPDARPSARVLRRKLLEQSHNHGTSLPIFSGCCSENTSTALEHSGIRPQEEISEKNLVEEHTSIASVAWSGEQRLYVQGPDGNIREAIRRQHDSTWGARKFQDTFATGKLCTPIVATAWQQTSGYRQPEIRVYFLNKRNCIQEKAWDPLSGWSDGPLNTYKIRTAATSELAVTSWGDGNIILCYQHEDTSIRMLHGWARKSLWRCGTTIQDAAAPSPLEVVNFEHLGHHGVRLYYKRDDSCLREVCWDDVEDEAREKSGHYLGGYRKTAAPGACISAIAFKHADLEMFVYSSTGEDICENRYTGGWLPWDSKLGVKPNRSISAARLGPGSVSVYFVQGNRLGEIVHDNGNSTQTFISGATCRGPGCPHAVNSEGPLRTSVSKSPAATLIRSPNPTASSHFETRGSSETALKIWTQPSVPESRQQPPAVPESESPHRSFFKRALSSFLCCS
ncbi:kinase-like domain-containing protein [Biscogniauxia sp. FL1348]|nr:kinase-like domain-containing protein [Biscogniauxia sp. FL1348]